MVNTYRHILCKVKLLELLKSFYSVGTILEFPIRLVSVLFVFFCGIK